MEIEINGLLN